VSHHCSLSHHCIVPSGVCHPSTAIMCVAMVATPIRSSRYLLLLVCHRGKCLVEYGGRAYGLVNQNMAGHEMATGKKSFCQLPPGNMKYLRLRPQYIALDTVTWVLFSPGSYARAWLYPGAIVATTHLVTASSLVDMLKGRSVHKNDVSEAVKLDMHARYTSPC
jgi:hypothetical protein